MSDIIDRIDELVDEQLAGYRHRSGFDYNVGQDRCPRCGRHWHGLAITEHIDRMYQYGRYEPEYIAAEDNSPILCEGSDFIGPIRPSASGSLDGLLRERSARDAFSRQIYFSIIVDHTAMVDSTRRFRAEMQRLEAAFAAVTRTPPLQLGWRLNRSVGLFQLGGFGIADWYEEPNVSHTVYCRPTMELPDIQWTPGQHNWHYEIHRPPLQFPPSPHPFFRYVSPLESLIRQHWDEFTADSHPLPKFHGFDFSQYATGTEEQHGPAAHNPRRFR